jgi:hypothetical protein
VTTANDLLTALQKLRIPNLRLPDAPGLGKRLSSCRFREFQFLKTNTPGVPAVKREGRRRPIGFFRPDNPGQPAATDKDLRNETVSVHSDASAAGFFVGLDDSMTADDSSDKACCHELTDSIHEA